MFAGTLNAERKSSRRFSMKTQLFAPLVIAVLTATINANAATDKPPHSRSIIVQSPSDLPALAQANSEAMYLDKRADGKTVLYVESAEGTKLTALDVSDPGKIRRLAETKLVVPSRFDFVESVGNDSELVAIATAQAKRFLASNNANTPHSVTRRR